MYILHFCVWALLTTRQFQHLPAVAVRVVNASLFHRQQHLPEVHYGLPMSLLRDGWYRFEAWA